MTTKLESNQPKLYPYHEFTSSENLVIHSFKEIETDCTYFLLVSSDRPELSELWDIYDYRRPLTLDEIKRYKYHPENFIEDRNSRNYNRPIEHVATMTLSGPELDFYFTPYPDHVFCYDVGSMSGAAKGNRLIDAYLPGMAEIWRMSRFGKMLALHITKICPVCDGAGKVQWTTGKRTIKRHIKTCPHCKGHNSLQTII